MEINLLIWFIIIPFAVALLNTILPVVVKKVLNLAALLLLLILLWPLYSNTPGPVGWLGYTVLRLDELALFSLIFTQIISLVIFLFALKGLDPAIENKFLILYPLTLSFCNAVLLSDNMIAFLIFWGLSGLGLYLFALLGQTKDAPQTAKKTFILIGGSDAFLILGLATLWFLRPESNWSLLGTQVTLDNSNAIIAFIMLIIAAFTKAGGFPFHTWVPDFSKDAQVESAAFLPASLDKLLGIYLLGRIMITLFTTEVLVQLIVISFGALTVISAVMMAMNQHNGRKLLGYHAVSQVGYMIMGIGSGHPLAFAGGLFHMINHIIYKSNLFLSLGAVEKQTKTNELNDLGGLAKYMPLTFLAALIGALSISGIPPFNGFFSKWMIYQGLLEKTSALTAGYQLWLLVCIILALFGSVLTLASFMKFLHAIFLGKPLEKFKNVKDAPFNQVLALTVLSSLCIVFGLFAIPLPLKNFIFPVVQSLGLGAVNFTGIYDPLVITVLLAIGFLVGIFTYRLVRKVRYDDVYLGGMTGEEQFRISGTEFYKEIRQMYPLSVLFRAAEDKKLDVYNVSGNSTFVLSRFFRKAHPGQLQLYVLYIVFGLIIFIWLI